MTDAKTNLIQEIKHAYLAGLLRYKHFPYAVQLDFDDKIDQKTLRTLRDYINTKYHVCVNKIVLNPETTTMFIYM